MTWIHRGACGFAITLLFFACTPTFAPIDPTAQPSSSITSRRAEPPPISEHDAQLRDSCEAQHDPMACIAGAAATSNAVVAHTLLFHGCFLGARLACRELVKEQMTLENKPSQRARDEAEQALTEGCMYKHDDACAASGSFMNGDDDTLLLGATKSSPANGTSATPQFPPRDDSPERRAQAMELQYEVTHLQTCVTGCSDDYTKCATACSGRSTSIVKRCVGDCVKHMTPCMHTCGDKSQAVCATKFPLFCDSFKMSTQAYSNFEMPDNTNQPGRSGY